MSQLTLPFPPLAPGAAWAPVSVERFAPGRRGATTRLALRGRAVVLRLRAGDDGAEARLHAESDAPGASGLALRVRRRPIFLAEVETDAPAPLHWGLGAGPALRDARDFFGYAHRWACRALSWGDPHRARRHAVRLAVAGLLAEAARPLAAQCEGALAAAARRFLPPARARLYGLLTRDGRGWVRQAARASPGALLLGLALADERETSEAGVRLLHDLGEGRRLDEALDAALAAWEAALPAWTGEAGPWSDDQRRAFLAAARLDAPARARQRAAMRLLARRAGPWVEPRLLLLPPPLRFAPEDVPAAPLENARWFRVMKVARVTVPAVGALAGDDFLGPFAAFASRHAGVLGRPPPGLDLGDWLFALAGLLRAQERVPSRATDPARLVAAVDVAALRARPLGWQRPPPLDPPAQPLALAAPPGPPEAAAAAEALEAARRARAAPWRRSVPPIEVVHFPRWEDARADAEVVQLTSADQLLAEGARQRNCVASYAGRAERGGLVICSARVRRQRLTLSVVPTADGWRLSECAGFANREPTSAELGALAPWFAAHRIRVGGRRRR